MGKRFLTRCVLIAGAMLFSWWAGPGAPSLVEAVRERPSGLLGVSFDRYASGTTRDLPIGVFDSGIGGLTVLDAILRLDAFNNATHAPGADGRPDFEDERFIYLGDQANMPYGDYSAANKTEFLRELILSNVVFLCGGRYWPSVAAAAPRGDKPPVKAIVIACNTATAYGLERINAALKEWNLPVPVIGIVVAGAGGAVQAIAGRGGKVSVAVLATVGTCQSGGYVRAIEQKARESGIIPEAVIQQGCLGLASAVEGDPYYIQPPGAAKSVEYRGPAVGNKAAPIEPRLLEQYGFNPGGLLGDLKDASTWRINSVENYIRYHAAALMDTYRRSGGTTPIASVILGCTHFPFYKEEIESSFRRLRDYRGADGKAPYKHLIAENLAFIDPSELTAKQLYETLAGARLLIGKPGGCAIGVDEFFISVPNAGLPGVKLDEAGGFTYEYKYGRETGHFDWEYVKRVPMDGVNLSQAVRETIRLKMPSVWNRLVLFDRESPRAKEVPEAARIKAVSNH